VTYLLLAYVEFKDRRWDEAVATSRKAHAFEQHDAFVHRVAARAFEQKNQPAQASEELEQFLEEEPIGPHADAARKELELVRAIPH
jgi:regulator of sirC expression with transglutaminase-like and TPR domain